MNIVIVDYHMGNINSIINAFETLGVDVTYSHEKEVILNADALVLPGVGAFGEAIHQLQKLELHESITSKVVEQKTPILGICLGMQLLATHSNEMGSFQGFNFIEGEVKMLDLKNLPLPHVGWNNISLQNPSELFEGIDENAHFYFDHSFHLLCDEEYVSATCDYEGSRAIAIKKEHIFGVQFHPEKSQKLGLKLLRSFINYVTSLKSC